MKLFSYVVEHDTGHAPNPYFDSCTLCRCKYRKHPGGRPNVVELAKRAKEKGEIVWVVGTGGANRDKSAGHGKIVYAMRVDEVLSRGEYYYDRRFGRKKRLPSGIYEQQRGDNIRPSGKFKTWTIRPCLAALLLLWEKGQRYPSIIASPREIRARVSITVR